MSKTAQLKDLKDKLYQLSKDATAGKIDQKVAAEQIIELRTEIAEISKHLNKHQIKGAK
jgi:hypothetical protein